MKNKRLKRIILTIISLFSLYLLAGFFLVPYILKTQIIKKVSLQTGRVVKLEKVQFNPLVLSVYLKKFIIEGKKYKKFVQLDELYINFQLSSIFKMALVFDEVRLMKPYISISRETKDIFNFSDLLIKKSEEVVVNQEKLTKILPVEINKFILSHGYFIFSDHSRNKPKDLILEDLSFELEEFSTVLEPDESNKYRFIAKGPKGGELSWLGTFRLFPIESRGKIVLKNIGLTSFVNFYEEELNFTLPKGVFSFETEYAISEEPVWGINLSKGKYQVNDIEVNDKQQKTLIQLPLFSLSDVFVMSREQKLIVKNIKIDKPLINLLYGSEGLNLRPIFDFSALSTIDNKLEVKDISKVNQQNNWYWELSNINIDNLSIHLLDNTVGVPQKWLLDLKHIEVNDIIGDGYKEFQVVMKGTLNQVTTLNIKGSGRIKPVSLILDIDEQGFPLKTVQPYITPLVQIRLVDGILSNQMRLDLKFDEKNTLSKMTVTGDSVITKLHIDNKILKNRLVQWDRLSVNYFNFDLLKNKLHIKKVIINKPYLKVQINEDRTTNFKDLIINQDNKVAEKSKNKPDFELSIDDILYKNGVFSFADLSLKPDFVTEIVHLKGKISGASNIQGRKSTINLEGKVDRYAPVTINGTGNILVKPPVLDVNMAFKNMELSSVTPYSGTYAGYKIDRGQLSVNLKYQLDNNTLHGENKIIVKHLQFGDKVESQKAVSLPLKLAVALLSDENGIIDLDLLVEGDINDPDFSMAGLVWKVVRNVVVKVVTSPFKFLAGLAGGDDNLDYIDFEAGSTEIYQDMNDKLGILAKALKARTQLILQIKGSVDIIKDSAAIKADTINQIITMRSNIDTVSVGGVDNASLDAVWLNVVSEEYFDMSGEKSYMVFKRLHGEAVIIADKDNKTIDNSSIQLSTANYMYNYIREKQVVTDETLISLANERAQNVKAILAENYQIGGDRLFLNSANLGSDKTEAVVRFTLDVGK